MSTPRKITDDELTAMIEDTLLHLPPADKYRGLHAALLELRELRAENERLTNALASKRDAAWALASFGLACFDEHRAELGDLDGSWLQDTAERRGLLAGTAVTEPCCDNCRCVEWDDFPQDCLRETEIVKAFRADNERLTKENDCSRLNQWTVEMGTPLPKL